MDIIVSEKNNIFVIELKSQNNSTIKKFETPEKIFEFFKDDIPLSNSALKINIEDSSYKILVKNIFDKILKYQQNNGITLEYITTRNKLLKSGGKLNTKFDNLEKIALNESSRKDIIAVDKMAIYKLYADVLLEKLNSILANYIDNQNIEQLKLQYTTLKESNMNLTNMISQGYTIHKTISLIKLRNYISTILMKLEQLQKLAKAPNKDEAMLKILKEMAKTKNFSELEKYGDVLDSPEYSIDTKLQYITDIKNNNNITLTTKLMDYFFKTDNPRIKEHIVWALQDYRAPNIFKFLKELMVNTAESSDVRIAAALAISTFPDPPPEVKLIIKKLRTNIVHSSEAVKNKEISKLPDILLIDIETRQVSEYMLKSITSDYLKFISQTELKPKSIYILQFKDLKLPEVFSFNIEIIFSVFDQKLGVYLNRAKFLKKFAFEKDQIDFIVNGLKTNQINIENYFIEKNEINSKIFPCRFHPDYPYSQKSDFYKKHGDKCSELMTLNFYLDTGLNWKVIKCSECKKILNLK